MNHLATSVNYLAVSGGTKNPVAVVLVSIFILAVLVAVATSIVRKTRK